MTSVFRNHLRYLLVGTCMALSAPVLAQEQAAQDADAGGLKEIVVTAQKQAPAGIGALASLGTPREYGVNFRYGF